LLAAEDHAFWTQRAQLYLRSWQSNCEVEAVAVVLRFLRQMLIITTTTIIIIIVVVVVVIIIIDNNRAYT